MGLHEGRFSYGGHEADIPMRTFYQNTQELLETIDECVQKRRTIPALVLLYTGLDVLASLERRSDEGTRAAFVRWIEWYLLPARRLPCDARELYGARCGILHTFAAGSDLSRKGTVREVIYAWGTGTCAELQEAAEHMRPGRYVAIHIHDLVEAFRIAMDTFVEHLSRDSARWSAVSKRAVMWFTNASPNVVEKFNELQRGRG
jgi:hypothetical protein